MWLALWALLGQVHGRPPAQSRLPLHSPASVGVHSSGPFAAQSVAHRAATAAPPGSVLEMQSPGPSPRPAGLGSAARSPGGWCAPSPRRCTGLRDAEDSPALPRAPAASGISPACNTYRDGE